MAWPKHSSMLPITENSGSQDRRRSRTSVLFIAGDWGATASNAFSSSQVFYDLMVIERNGATGTTLFSQLLDYRTMTNQPNREICHAAGSSTLTPCTGLFTFAIPFVFGTSFDFDYNFNVHSESSTSNGSGTSFFDLSNSLLWGGISSVTVAGNAVNYDFQSASGFDWQQSSIPTTLLRRMGSRRIRVDPSRDRRTPSRSP